MIDIKFKEDIYTVKTDINEFTIDEFEDIYYIVNSNLCKYDKVVKILIRLGIEINLIANLDANDIFNIMKEFNFDYVNGDIKQSIELFGTTYSCYDKSFKLTVKNMLLIESYIKINPKKYFAEILAILYTNKKCKLTLKEKTKLIRENITSDIAIPLINIVSISIIDNLKFLAND